MKFCRRAEWGARPAEKRALLRNPDGIALHWNGPPLSLADHARCAEAVRKIQAFHMDDPSRRWADVAYTALVCPHGWVYEGRGPGARTAANGTNDGNDRFYAVMLLAGEGDPFTDEARRGLRDAAAWLQSIDAGPEIRCHSHFKSTACPGDELREYADLLERQLSGQQDVQILPAPEVPMVEVPVPRVAELRIYTQGKWVKKLQGLLVAHGHEIDVDGRFGPKTELALNRHKTAHGLPDPNVADAGAWLSLVEK